MEKTEIVMDYEKAYKAVLQTATQWIKDGCTDKEKICLECVFPELAESEDERVRKGLIEVVSDIAGGWPFEEHRITKKEALAYLEKQKEDLTPEEKMNHPLYLEGFDVGREVGKVEAEQKPAEWSEEEKQKLNRIYEILGYAADDKGFLTSKRIIGDKEAIELQDFLKSLRSSWKPSEEQMGILKAVKEHVGRGSGYWGEGLGSLIKDLEKLM